MITRTCNGDCCAVVGLSFSYRQMAEFEEGKLRDQDTLLDMLEPITYEEARERARTLTSMGADYNPDTRRFFYKCNRWNEETRLCSRYDERPQMCAAYPYDKKCDIDGCGYTPPQDVVDAWIRSSPAPEDPEQ